VRGDRATSVGIFRGGRETVRKEEGRRTNRCGLWTWSFFFYCEKMTSVMLWIQSLASPDPSEDYQHYSFLDAHLIMFEGS
jgi:hypothetical protein